MNYGTYTIIVDIAGGTYISQHRARTPADAVIELFNCPSKEVEDAIGRYPAGHLDMLPKYSRDMIDLEPIKGIKSVWFGYFNINQKDMFLNIVLTDV